VQKSIADLAEIGEGSSEKEWFLARVLAFMETIVQRRNRDKGTFDEKTERTFLHEYDEITLRWFIANDSVNEIAMFYDANRGKVAGERVFAFIQNTVFVERIYERIEANRDKPANERTVREIIDGVIGKKLLSEKRFPPPSDRWLDNAQKAHTEIAEASLWFVPITEKTALFSWLTIMLDMLVDDKEHFLDHLKFGDKHDTNRLDDLPKQRRVSYNYFKEVILRQTPEVHRWLLRERGEIFYETIKAKFIPSEKRNHYQFRGDRDAQAQFDEFDRNEAEKHEERITRNKRIMKELGFPYADTYEEYVRFVRNFYLPMTFYFGGKTFELYIADILSIIVPYRRTKRVLREDIQKGNTYIVGRSGSGKTELLKTVFVAVTTSYQASPAIVIDPHGDLADDLCNIEGYEDLTFRVAPHERRFVINPFDTDDKSPENRELVSQEITDLVGELVADSGLSRLMETVMQPIVYTLLKLPYADFSMLVDCINPETGKERLRALRPLVETHHRGIWDMIEGDTYDTSKQSIFNRLQSLLNYRLIKQTLCGRDDFTKAVEEITYNKDFADKYHLAKPEHERRAIVFSFPSPTIGETVSDTLGRFVMTRMQIWAKRRQKFPESDRFPVSLIVDEFQNFLSPATAKTLDQFARKFGVPMVLAHQHIAQIDDRKIRGSILTNTKNKIAGMTNADTRQAMKKEAGIDEEALESLKAGHFIAKFDTSSPFPFYARMVKLDRSIRYEYAPSQNTDEIIDGWHGFESERSIPADGGKATPKKTGYTPKFDL
jgi:energy-coupling factor transporter ATP-binding protein EcfA2